MKIIPVFLFITFLILAAGCEDDQKRGGAEVFFPLNQGDKWVFNDGGQDWTLETGGIHRLGGTDYTAMVRVYQRSSDTSYFRTDGADRVFIYWEGKEYLYIDFARSTGDIWSTYNDFTGAIEEKGKILSLPAGTFDNVTQVIFNNSAIQDAYEFRDFAAGAGLVQITAFRRVSKLKSANVNGITYP